VRFDLRSPPFPIEPALTPDAYLELSAPSGVRASFLEVDLGTEALPVWRSKVERYLALARSGAVERLLGHPHFSVLAVTHSRRRMESLRTSTRGLTDKIFWFADIPTIKSEGVYSAVWMRPAGEDRLPFI
jgi:hypothetical protein